MSSAADPLPTAFPHPRFPLSAGSAKSGQRIDFKKILYRDGAIFRGENAFFRCRQGNCDGLVIVGVRP